MRIRASNTPWMALPCINFVSKLKFTGGGVVGLTDACSPRPLRYKLRCCCQIHPCKEIYIIFLKEETKRGDNYFFGKKGERATALARAFASRSSQVILLFIITESQISASMRSCVQTSGDTPSIEPVL